MSDRLRNVMTEYLIKQGDKGKAYLARRMDKSLKTIDRWAKDGVSDPRKSYKLALACGCSEDEALEIAKQCLPIKAREPA